MVDSTSSPTVDWGRALVAGLAATVVMTVTMALFGTNLMKDLGMMLAPTSSATVQYLAGGAQHLLIGLFYALVYAKFFSPVQGWSRAVKGLVYGLVVAALAFALMPVMASMMAGGAASPCSPCGPAAATPCNPCGGGGSPYGGLISVINHMIYGLVLTFLYRPRSAKPA